MSRLTRRSTEELLEPGPHLAVNASGDVTTVVVSASAPRSDRWVMRALKAPAPAVSRQTRMTRAAASGTDPDSCT